MNYTILLTILITVYGLNTVSAQEAKGTNRYKGESQYNNTVELSSCAFYIRGKHEHLWPFAQIGLGYERKVKNNWRLGIGYSQRESYSGIRPYIYENPGFVNEVDELILRSAYKMIDIYINYHLLIMPKHSLYTGGAFSYNWGRNEYVEWISKAALPYYDTQWSSYIKKVNYRGGVFMLGYDYWCYNNRVNIGFDYRLRSYIGRPENQHDIGFHIGYNF